MKEEFRMIKYKVKIPLPGLPEIVEIPYDDSVMDIFKHLYERVEETMTTENPEYYFVLLEDSDRTMKSIPEPTGEIVRTQEEAESWINGHPYRCYHRVVLVEYK